jgi:hypothetical protein
MNSRVNYADWINLVKYNSPVTRSVNRRSSSIRSGKYEWLGNYNLLKKIN